ncbi:MAG: ABC transporter ATP-binding protein [Deltaproteobacteria bacterium]
MFLDLKNIKVSYDSVEALKGISLEVDKARIVCLLGGNGAGKSTILKAISGLVPVSSGEIYFDGQRIDSLRCHHIVQKGIAHVPEERRLFGEMSVLENLEMGAYLQRNRRKLKDKVDEVLAIFPRLNEKLKQRAGTLSGGEQQMAAIGRALMSGPRLLLMDEPTLGLSPLLCEAVIDCTLDIQQHGTSILLAEQNAELALLASNEGYIVRLGEIILRGSSQELVSDERVKKAYLGE